MKKIKSGYANKTRSKILAATIFETLLKHKFPLHQINLVNEYLNDRITSRKELNNLLSQIQQNIPVEYIVNYTYFYGFKFIVKKGSCKTYIPAPYTERLVDTALSELKQIAARTHTHEKLLVIDIGTGSGAILLSIVANLFLKTSKTIHHQNITVIGTDIDKCAIQIAKLNAKQILKQNHKGLYHPGKIKDINLQFINTNLIFHSYIQQQLYKADTILITFNKPYILPEQYKSLEKQMYFYPKIALVETSEFKQNYNRFIRYIRKLKSMGKKLIYIQETRYSKHKQVPKIVTYKNF